MMGWNYVDALLVLTVLLSAWNGWQRGFIIASLSLLSWAASLLLALRFYQPLSQRIAPRAGWPEIWDRPIAFVLAAMLGGMFINLAGHLLLRRVPQAMHRRPFNRTLGLLPGLAAGLLSAAIGAALLLALPLPATLRAAVQASTVAQRLAAQTQRFAFALVPVFGDPASQTLNTLTIRPGSDEMVKLPFTVEDAGPAPRIEAEMLALINQERATAGLAPLSADPALAEVARRHSTDMFARGYFAHTSPEGTSPFDRIAAADIAFRTAGENLALAPTLALVHSGLMSSPGHRANILHPDFGRAGIGIVDGGLRGLMVTQLFRD